MEVETLIQQMQDTLTEIGTTVNKLSGKAQYDELNQLEQKRDSWLAELESSFAKDGKQLQIKRRTELDDIKKKRKQEDEERTAQRRREDEDLKKANLKEDKQRQRKYDKEVDSIDDDMSHKMDEVEETARKMDKEGKESLQNLAERRKELNRRIDEQLNQPLPKLPSRKKDKDQSKKGVSNSSKANLNDNSIPSSQSNIETNSKASTKSDTPSNNLASSIPETSTKSPEVKKDGEVPLQDKSNGHLQGSKESTKNLPKSFAEVLTNNMSNESKAKPKPEKGSSDQINLDANDYSGHRSSMIGVNKHRRTDTGTRAGLASEVGNSISEGIDITKPTKSKKIPKEENIIKHIDLPPGGESRIKQAEIQCNNDDLARQNPLISQHTHSDKDINSKPERHSPTESTKSEQSNPDLNSQREHEVVKVGEMKSELQAQPPSSQHGASNTKNPKSKQSIINTTGKRSESSVASARDGHSSTYTPEVASRSVAQISKLSLAPDQRSRRQDQKEHDQVGFEQPTVPYLLGAGHTSTDYSEALKRPKPSNQLSRAPADDLFLAPPSPIRAGFTHPQDQGVFGFSPDHGLVPDHDKKSPDPGTRYLHASRNRLREKSRKSSSPLPVDNETVHGQEQLFDYFKGVSGPSEPDTGDESSDHSPKTPPDGQHLPVL
ncbi:hypothetical protein SAMD00023353_4400040 [Rosellinia necatrix]|uniref:Uncharacterized protein n=1 Tax=Rosellinia necatrix TaxID=77044 RepID=A0A1W2TNG7_ROSNE|nr:hypothetical protein SAMD00023353_4400040 [Rosellinia necatrix]